MKTVAMATIALMMLAGIALADQSSCALTEVEVKIVSNVSVGGSDHVNLGEYQQGDIPADLTFQVESNCEAVKLCVFATDLYKGNPDDPNNPYSIPVDVDQPVIIDAPGTNPVAQVEPELPWDGQATGDDKINGMPTHKTVCVEFESSNNGQFGRKAVGVELHYNQADMELPRGFYSGWVKVCGMVDLLF